MPCLRSQWFTAWCTGVLALLNVGCAGWLPVSNEPTPIQKSFSRVEISRDTVGIESIVIRLDSHQTSNLADVWSALDEQVVAPELRIAMDRNGLRAGKASGHLPAMLEQWVRANEQRREEDPLEQVGLAADVSTFAQLWRCRPNSSKELTVRKLMTEDATVFFYEGALKGAHYRTPHFLFKLETSAVGDGSAKVRLVPELKHGEVRRIVVAKDSAIRTDERQEEIIWDSLAVEMRLNHGDCIVLGATPTPRGLGEHFFQTRTKDGNMQHVLLLVRLSETRLDDAFAPEEIAAARRGLGPR